MVADKPEFGGFFGVFLSPSKIHCRSFSRGRIHTFDNVCPFVVNTTTISWSTLGQAVGHNVSELITKLRSQTKNSIKFPEYNHNNGRNDLPVYRGNQQVHPLKLFFPTIKRNKSRKSSVMKRKQFIKSRNSFERVELLCQHKIVWNCIKLYVVHTVSRFWPSFLLLSLK